MKNVSSFKSVVLVVDIAKQTLSLIKHIFLFRVDSEAVPPNRWTKLQGSSRLFLMECSDFVRSLELPPEIFYESVLKDF